MITHTILSIYRRHKQNDFAHSPTNTVAKCRPNFALTYDTLKLALTGECCAVNVPLPLTDTVQLPVNGPCKSRYLAKNVICSTVLSLNIQLYYCIVVFPRLYPNTTYMPNTDYTDYTDHKVVFIIWTDNVNTICATTISSNLQLWYCIPVFPRLYPSNTYPPNTDYTDYTDKRVVFIIWTDNVNAFCATTISSNLQLWYYIAVFLRLYPPNTFLPNTDYTDYTGYRVVLDHLHR